MSHSDDGPATLLRRADIAAMTPTEKTHFLNPNAVRRNRSLGDATGLTGLGVHLVEVEPGHESTEYHAHLFEDEATWVLSGSGTVTIGGTEHAIGAGDCIGYPAGGEAHTMRATGDRPLVCLVVGQRLDHDVADYPRKAKRIYRNRGQPWDLVDHGAIAAPPAGTGSK